MSEYGSLYVTTCDKCTLEARSLVPLFEMVSRMPSSVRGVFYGGFDLAQIHAGWEERDYGHICPDCAREEKEEEARDEAGGAVSGAINESDLPGASQVIKRSMKEHIAQERLDVKLAVERANAAIARGENPAPEDTKTIVDFVYADDWGAILPVEPLDIPISPEKAAEVERRLNEMGVVIPKENV